MFCSWLKLYSGQKKQRSYLTKVLRSDDTEIKSPSKNSFSKPYGDHCHDRAKQDDAQTFYNICCVNDKRNILIETHERNLKKQTTINAEFNHLETNKQLNDFFQNIFIESERQTNNLLHLVRQREHLFLRCHLTQAEKILSNFPLNPPWIILNVVTKTNSFMRGFKNCSFSPEMCIKRYRKTTTSIATLNYTFYCTCLQRLCCNYCAPTHTLFISDFIIKKSHAKIFAHPL